jgi:hypothetical protein
MRKSWNWKHTLRVFHLRDEEMEKSVCWAKSLRGLRLTSNPKKVTCRNCKKIMEEDFKGDITKKQLDDAIAAINSDPWNFSEDHIFHTSRDVFDQLEESLNVDESKETNTERNNSNSRS